MVPTVGQLWPVRYSWGPWQGLVLDANLGDVGAVATEDLPRVMVASTLAAFAYVASQTILIRRAVKIVFGSDNLEPWSKMGVLFGSQVAMGLLGGLIGAAYLIANRPAILVLIVGVYGIGHMSLYAFAQLRDSHIGVAPGVRQDTRSQRHVHEGSYRTCCLLCTTDR